MRREGLRNHWAYRDQKADYSKLAICCFDLSRQWEEIAQARKVNRTRGAWRRPAVAGTVSALEKSLRALYDETEHKIVLALVGESAEQQVSGDTGELETAALEHHGLTVEDGEKPVDRKVLSAILLLLALLRSTQLGLAGETIQATYDASRAALLKRLKRPDAPALPATSPLAAQVVTQFEADAQRLYTSLLDGTARAEGTEVIVSSSATVSDAVLRFRTLFAAEAFRLSMFAEALVWAAWMAGFRAAAVDGTQAALAAGEESPRFQWIGPDDSRTCDPCHSRFGEPVVARSLADLPDPWTVCEYRRACRHAWQVV